MVQSSSSTPSRTARSIGSPLPGSVVSAACNRTSSRSSSPQDHHVGHRELVLGDGSGLVRAEDVHARHLLHGRQVTDQGLASGQVAGADRHGHRQHGGEGHRDGCDRHHERELERGRHAGPSKERDGHDEVTRTRATAIRYLPIERIARWRWLGGGSIPASSAVRPNSVAILWPARGRPARRA